MKMPRRVSATVLSIVQTVLLVGADPIAVSAASAKHSSGESHLDAQSQLDNYEMSVFGKTSSELSTDERLNNLETNMLGAPRSGSTAKRLTALSKALGAQKGIQLLPPMAPQMDTSSNTAKEAPALSRGQSYSSGEASSVGSATNGGAINGSAREELRSAMSLYSQGRMNEAESGFRKVIAIDKGNTDAYYNLGVLLEGKGDLAGALSNYRAAADLNPSDQELSSAVSSVEGKLSTQRQAANAGQEEAANRAKTTRLKGLVTEAATAYKSGNFDKAISDLNQVASQEPNDPDVQYALAQAYKAKGQLRPAQEALNRALADQPNNQTYKAAMVDLNKRISQGGGRSSGSGGTGTLSSFGNGNASGQTTSFAGDSQPSGQITPFAGDDTGSRSVGGYGGSLLGSSGRSAASLFGGLLGGRMGGLGMSGGMMNPGMMNPGMINPGMINPGMMNPGMMNPGMMGGGLSYNRSMGGYGGGGQLSGLNNTRLKRAAVGGLTGAAMGALSAKMMHGSAKQGAMQGALMGGMLGLFTGY